MSLTRMVAVLLAGAALALASTSTGRPAPTAHLATVGATQPVAPASEVPTWRRVTDGGVANAPVAAASPAVPPAARPARAHAATPASGPPQTVVAPGPAQVTAPLHRNLLLGPDGLDSGLGTYGDCTGLAAVPRGMAVVDTCMTDVVYVMGHNPGVFTPLVRLATGDALTWYDAAGTPHALRVSSVRQWLRTAGEPPPTSPDVVMMLQTCLVPDGSVDVILDAVPA